MRACKVSSCREVNSRFQSRETNDHATDTMVESPCRSVPMTSGEQVYLSSSSEEESEGAYYNVWIRTGL